MLPTDEFETSVSVPVIRKLIFRTFLVGTAVFGVCVLSCGTAAFLAFQRPDFYAELAGQTEADSQTTAEMERKTREFEEWARKAAALSARYSRNTALSQTNEPGTRDVPEKHSLEISELELNGLFASKRFNAGDFRNPRVQILKEQLRVGAEMHLGDCCLIISAYLKPMIASDGSLQLEIVKSHVGSLPFPLHTLLTTVAPHTNLSKTDFGLNLTGDTPVLTIDINKGSGNGPSVAAIQCAEDSITIEFQAANPEQSQRLVRNLHL